MKTAVWLSLFVFTSGTAALQAPYNTPEFVSLSSDSWPSASKWQSLNASLGGRLEILRPWAAVCYFSDPLFDYGKCQAVLTGYDNDTTASQTPVLLILQTLTIPPIFISAKACRRLCYGQIGKHAATGTGAP